MFSVMTSLTVTCSIVWLLLAFVGENESMADDFSEFSRESIKQTRVKRSLSGGLQLLEGMAATWKLLRGTKLVVSPKRGKSGYLKEGSSATAVDDFYKVYPTDIRDFETPKGSVGKTGRVGNLQITVEHLPGVTNSACMTIVKDAGTKGRRTETIILYNVP